MTPPADAPSTGAPVLGRFTGARVLQAVGIFLAGSVLLFQFGPYPRLKTAMGGRAFPEEGVTDAVALQAFLSELGEAGRALYREVQFWDLLNPLLLGLLGVALVGWLARRALTVPWRHRLVLVPLVAPVADLLENGVLLLALGAFPEASPAAPLLPAISAVKFAGLVATLALVAGVAGLWVLRRASGRSAVARG